MEINIENMTNPPEKMRLMFEAVSEFIREQRDISSIKVQDITAKAGIGKGTAYEYFSSKDELIANALMYEYSQKMQQLAASAFEPKDFKSRCFRVMEWIKENKEYNQMFSQLMKNSLGASRTLCDSKTAEPNRFESEAHNYIYKMVDQFMEDGFQQGIYKETDIGKRSLALLTAMVEYSFVVMGPAESRYQSIGDDNIREFIYKGLVNSLV